MFYMMYGEKIACDEHGTTKAAMHRYVEDPTVPEEDSFWLVCLDCAKRMDTDPEFKASKRPHFDLYQRHRRQYEREQAARGNL